MSDDHPFLELIRKRATVEDFDPARPVDESTVRELIADASWAPSSFNIQHWRFVAVRRDEDKRALCEAAYGQEQVLHAAVTLIVLGDVAGIEKLPAINRRAVESGALPAGKAEAWERMAQAIYGDPAMARDEALRSACLVSMTLMLAAEARGLATGALSGFDPVKVRAAFAIEERYLPVLLVALGHPAATSPVRQPRLDVDEVLSFDRGRRF